VLCCSDDRFLLLSNWVDRGRLREELKSEVSSRKKGWGLVENHVLHSESLDVGNIVWKRLREVIELYL
jgi:hypothetical protein